MQARHPSCGLRILSDDPSEYCVYDPSEYCVYERNSISLCLPFFLLPFYRHVQAYVCRLVSIYALNCRQQIA